MLCTAILVLNNLRDIETDRDAGKWTLAARVGPRATGAMYLGCLAVAAAAPGVLRAVGLTGAWFWLPWLAGPRMGALVRAALLSRAAATLNRALRQTAALHLLFGMLLAASFLL